MEQIVMAQSLGAAIREWLRVSNLDVPLKEHSAPAYWQEVVGELLAQHVQIERIDKGTLFLKADSASWRSEVMLRREEIRDKVNERLGAEIVRVVLVR
jgi:predicted nucleic acid-binding Zn ribbon protein